jgi:hypothetical protein
MHQPSRRRVLQGGLLTVAMAAAGNVATMSPAQAAVRRRLRRSMFTPYVGTWFQLVAPGRFYPVQVTAVTDQNALTAGSETEFSVLFQALLSYLPPERIYSVQRPGVHSVNLFVSPITGKKGLYEAVISS